MKNSKLLAYLCEDGASAPASAYNEGGCLN